MPTILDWPRGCRLEHGWILGHSQHTYYLNHLTLTWMMISHLRIGTRCIFAKRRISALVCRHWQKVIKVMTVVPNWAAQRCGKEARWRGCGSPSAQKMFRKGMLDWKREKEKVKFLRYKSLGQLYVVSQTKSRMKLIVYFIAILIVFDVILGSGAAEENAVDQRTAHRTRHRLMQRRRNRRRQRIRQLMLADQPPGFALYNSFGTRRGQITSTQRGDRIPIGTSGSSTWSPSVDTSRSPITSQRSSIPTNGMLYTFNNPYLSVTNRFFLN